jgi:hypothetical protein
MFWRFCLFVNFDEFWNCVEGERINVVTDEPIQEHVHVGEG